jgi:hypothetical protein
MKDVGATHVLTYIFKWLEFQIWVFFHGNFLLSKGILNFVMWILMFIFIY